MLTMTKLLRAIVLRRRHPLDPVSTVANAYLNSADPAQLAQLLKTCREDERSAIEAALGPGGASATVGELLDEQWKEALTQDVYDPAADENMTIARVLGLTIQDQPGAGVWGLILRADGLMNDTGGRDRQTVAHVARWCVSMANGYAACQRARVAE